MKLKWGFLSLLSRLGKDQHASGPGLLARLLRDEEGSYLIYMTLIIPVVIGVAGLGTEGGRWLYIHQSLQNAADSAALSAAAAVSKGLDAGIDPTTVSITQAKAIAATYCTVTGDPSTCLVDGQNNVTVTVNPFPNAAPPRVEVTVARPETRLFSSLWLSNSQNISSSAVAILNDNTVPCIMSLATTGRGIFTTFKNGKSTINNLNINMTSCSMFSNSSGNSAGNYSIDIQGNNNVINVASIGAVGTVFESGNKDPYAGPIPPTSGDLPVVDPYLAKAATWPPSSTSPPSCVSGCTNQNAICSPSCDSNTNLLPGVYPNGINLNKNNTTYTMSPGVYYLQGDFNASGQHGVLNATNGVTVVLLGNANFNETSNNATLNITAPTTGWNAGIAIWAPTSSGNIQLTAGNSDVANVTGAVYAPNALVVYNGNTASNNAQCTQIVANQIQFGGNSGNLQGNCNLPGVAVFGRAVALVE